MRFLNYLLIVDIYYNLQIRYGMKNVTTEEVMNKLDIFKPRLEK